MFWANTEKKTVVLWFPEHRHKNGARGTRVLKFCMGNNMMMKNRRKKIESRFARSTPKNRVRVLAKNFVIDFGGQRHEIWRFWYHIRIQRFFLRWNEIFWVVWVRGCENIGILEVKIGPKIDPKIAHPFTPPYQFLTQKLVYIHSYKRY